MYKIRSKAATLPPFWHVKLFHCVCSGPHLEFPSFSQILDTFEWLVLLSIHIQTTHLETCERRSERVALQLTSYSFLH